jgi:hypothetical protein
VQCQGRGDQVGTSSDTSRTAEERHMPSCTVSHSIGSEDTGCSNKEREEGSLAEGLALRQAEAVRCLGKMAPAGAVAKPECLPEVIQKQPVVAVVPPALSRPHDPIRFDYRTQTVVRMTRRSPCGKKLSLPSRLQVSILLTL